MESRTCRLLTAVLLLPLAAPAPAPALADTANVALRKQIAAPLVLLRATGAAGGEA